MERIPTLKRHEFCAGGVAPDCSVPDDGRMEFTPPGEAAHRMRGKRKQASDCEVFRLDYIVGEGDMIGSGFHFFRVIMRIRPPMPDCGARSGTGGGVETYKARSGTVRKISGDAGRPGFSQKALL